MPSFRVRRVRFLAHNRGGEHSSSGPRRGVSRVFLSGGAHSPLSKGAAGSAQKPKSRYEAIARLQTPERPGLHREARQTSNGERGCAERENDPTYLRFLLGHGDASGRDLSGSESARALLGALSLLARLSRLQQLLARTRFAPSEFLLPVGSERVTWGMHVPDARSRAMLGSSGARSMGWRR